MTIGVGIYCFVSICAAFIIKGIAGFGDPLVYSPLLSVDLPNSLITPGMAPVSLLLNARMAWKNRRYLSLRMVLPIIVSVLLGIIPGTLLLRFGDPDGLKLLLGLLIIVLGLGMLPKKTAGKAEFNMALCCVISFCSGITAGLFGIDLFFLAYLERVSGAREEFRSNVCFVFLFECLFRGILYAAMGMFDVTSLVLTLIAVPAALIGMEIGGVIDRHIDDERFHKLIVTVFILCGVSNTVYAALALLA